MIYDLDQHIPCSSWMMHIVFQISLMQGINASVSSEVAEIKIVLNNEIARRKAAEDEVNILRSQLAQYRHPEVCFCFNLNLYMHKCLRLALQCMEYD